MALTIAQPSGGVFSSLDAGALSSGAQNQIIADSGALAAGNNEPWAYRCVVVSFQAGTVDTNLANLLLNVGGTAASNIVSGGITIGKLQSGAVASRQEFRVSVQSGQHVYVVVGNTTPGASSTYCASLSVTRLLSKYDF
jgi:hypothetical protein